MPCAPNSKLRRSEFTSSSSSGVSSPSSSSSSASINSMESASCWTVKKSASDQDLSVHCDDVVQALKYEHERQQIDKANRPLLPRDKSKHCKDCNLYLDGRTMTRCNKMCCMNLWYRYGKIKSTDKHPVVMAVYHKQANDTWMLHKTYADADD
jgi:CCR4-NOT transcriptional regulation complex NOT5 subunit